MAGKPRPGTAPIQIPTIAMLDLSGRSRVSTLGSGDARPILSGFTSAPGDYTADGGLTLDGAVLTVSGNLKVSGPVTGTGAIFVTGTTTITRGGSSLQTDQTVALASKGDVTISGAGKAESNFVGVVYTEGNFTASNVSLVGAFVANGQQRDGTTIGSTMTLTNVDMVQAPVKGVSVVNGEGVGYSAWPPARISVSGAPAGAQVAFLPGDASGGQWYRYSNVSGTRRRVAGPFSTTDVQVMVAPYLQASGSKYNPTDYMRVCASKPADRIPSTSGSGDPPADQTYTLDLNPGSSVIRMNHLPGSGRSP